MPYGRFEPINILSMQKHLIYLEKYIACIVCGDINVKKAFKRDIRDTHSKLYDFNSVWLLLSLWLLTTENDLLLFSCIFTL